MRVIKKHIRELFSQLPVNDASRTLRADLVQDMTEKYYLLRENGHDQQQAEEAVISTLPTKEQLEIEIAARTRDSRKSTCFVYGFITILAIAMVYLIEKFAPIDILVKLADTLAKPAAWICGTMLVLSIAYLFPAVRVRIPWWQVRLVLLIIASILGILYLYGALCSIVPAIPAVILSNPAGFAAIWLKISPIPFILLGVAFHYAKEG